MLEPLEPRRHLSTTLTGNVLTIIGTDRSDEIAIAAGRQFVVHVNGEQQAFDTDRIRTIRIHGLRGHDSIIVSPNLPIRCSIEAGPGNDRVGGGSGHDTIFGQQGDDTLVGNGGYDYIDAGAGDDLLIDAISLNTLHGGSGLDAALTAYRNAITSGVESVQGPNGETSTIGELNVRDGRLVLDYTVSMGSGGDSYLFEGPLPRADGRQEVRLVYKYSGGGANFFTFDETLDVTDSLSSGLIFARYENSISRLEYEQPLLLPL